VSAPVPFTVHRKKYRFRHMPKPRSVETATSHKRPFAGQRSLRDPAPGARCTSGFLYRILLLRPTKRPRAASAVPNSSKDPGSGVGRGVVASTGPIFPLGAKTPATKTLPKLFGTVRSAIVAFATRKLMGLLNAPAPPLAQAPTGSSVHLILKPKVPVPSPLNAPAVGIRILVGTVWSGVMSTISMPVPLNLKFLKIRRVSLHKKVAGSQCNDNIDRRSILS
jgi:hypothetical protein